MTKQLTAFTHFTAIKDFRQSAKVEHKLSDIILLTICAVLSGQDTWEGISDFGKLRLDFLREYGDFEQGIPSADTIARVLGMVNPNAMQRAFIEWMNACYAVTQGEVIAIDSKTVRGSYDKSQGRSAIHMVNAFATANRRLPCASQGK
ncbi:hypothetical protein BCT73_06525 [Vibrio breoganii]|nr:hypothetical protein BCT73_06525 [Vibrio breoganii]